MHLINRNSITIEIAAIMEGMARHVHTFAGSRLVYTSVDKALILYYDHFDHGS